MSARMKMQAVQGAFSCLSLGVALIILGSHYLRQAASAADTVIAGSPQSQGYFNASCVATQGGGSQYESFQDTGVYYYCCNYAVTVTVNYAVPVIFQASMTGRQCEATPSSCSDYYNSLIALGGSNLNSPDVTFPCFFNGASDVSSECSSYGPLTPCSSVMTAPEIANLQTANNSTSSLYGLWIFLIVFGVIVLLCGFSLFAYTILWVK